MTRLAVLVALLGTGCAASEAAETTLAFLVLAGILLRPLATRPA